MALKRKLSEMEEVANGVANGSPTSACRETVEDLYTFKIKRLMNPDDANIYGNVHGGSILKLIEEVGALLATRYCNHSPDGSSTDKPKKRAAAMAALVRVERTDFLQPMHIGEVAELEARMMYTSTHSMEVNVTVHAENVITASRRLTNRARLWYVPISIDNNQTVLTVPQMTHPSRRLTNRARLWYVPISIDDNQMVLTVPQMTHRNPADEERGRQDYVKQKAEREEAANAAKGRPRLISLADVSDDCEAQTVAFSKSQLIHLVGPSDLTVRGMCKGGMILKIMDECAGITAVKHCKTMVVTASFDAINLRKQVIKGGLLTATGQVTFTSSRSVEIEVVVDVETPWQPVGHKERVVDGFITFVSLSKDGKVNPIPEIHITTSEEQERYDAGKKRYEVQKQARISAKASASSNAQ